jgi:23S rRNA-/tRNA-specific pseudouridylate synthase
MKQNTRRRLRTTILILYCFGAKLWVRDAHSFHPTSHRRIASINNGFCRTTPADIKIYRHQRRWHCIADSLVTFESEIEIETTTKAAPANFDYRKIPPISDTTPCEVIQTCFDISQNTDDANLYGDISHGEEEFYFPSLEELASLPKGDRGGYHIVRQYTVVGNMGIDTSVANTNNDNCTLQCALTVLDPGNYPTLTRARKACRKGMVLVHHQYNKRIHIDRRGLVNQDDSGENGSSSSNNNVHFQRGNVGDLVAPGDVIGVQMFLGTYRKKQCYPNIEYSRPQFQLPILYEDDHLAVVNKPAGIAVYSETRNGETGTKTGNRRTVHFALPFVLTPPKKGTTGGILRRPGIVHRIDKPTSGLLLVAKTKAAMENLYEQFRNRDIQKIYTAIVNGDLMQHQKEYQQWKQEEEKDLEWQHRDGRDNDNHLQDLDHWNLIDYPLGGKYALTSWKILNCAPSLNARDGVLTMVQIRLHTGRYHQIRRHFAWWCRRPLVGDHLYAGLLQAHHFRKKGLFLCSNGISFLHPIPSQHGDDDDEETKNYERRRVEVVIDIPKRFDKLMKAEESWTIHKSKEKI